MFVFNVMSQEAADKKQLPLFCYELNRSDNKLKQLYFSLASSDAE
jgi:hypothetical protein